MRGKVVAAGSEKGKIRRGKVMEHVTRLAALIGLLLISLFFGVYAMVLELRGIPPYDQLLWSMVFGILAFLSKG